MEWHHVFPIKRESYKCMRRKDSQVLEIGVGGWMKGGEGCEQGLFTRALTQNYN